MAFRLSGPLTLKGYDKQGRPDFGLPGPAQPATAPDPVRQNRYGGKCVRPGCGKHVKSKMGECLLVDGVWVTRHKEGECPTPSSTPAPTATATVPAQAPAPPPPPTDPATPAQKARPVVGRRNAAPLTGYFTAQFGEDLHDYVTLRITRQGAFARFRPGELLVGYLMGSDNVDDYRNFANIDDKGRCWLWRNYADNTHLRQAVASVLGDQKAAGEAWARASRCCWKCGRLLTTPESLERLMGPDCWAEYN